MYLCFFGSDKVFVSSLLGGSTGAAVPSFDGSALEVDVEGDPHEKRVNDKYIASEFYGSVAFTPS